VTHTGDAATHEIEAAAETAECGDESVIGASVNPFDGRFSFPPSTSLLKVCNCNVAMFATAAV